MSESTNHIYEFGPFRLDPVERILEQEGQMLSLTPKVFETLLVLIKDSGRLVTKDKLMESVWQDTFVDEGTLTRTISRLRRALGEEGNGNKYIETVPRLGYRFVGDVSTCP